METSRSDDMKGSSSEGRHQVHAEGEHHERRRGEWGPTMRASGGNGTTPTPAAPFSAAGRPPRPDGAKA
eukprot:6422219-Pyramimonas_sp.AAC.1